MRSSFLTHKQSHKPKQQQQQQQCQMLCPSSPSVTAMLVPLLTGIVVVHLKEGVCQVDDALAHSLVEFKALLDHQRQRELRNVPEQGGRRGNE